MAKKAGKGPPKPKDDPQEEEFEDSLLEDAQDKDEEKAASQSGSDKDISDADSSSESEGCKVKRVHKWSRVGVAAVPDEEGDEEQSEAPRPLGSSPPMERVWVNIAPGGAGNEDGTSLSIGSSPVAAASPSLMEEDKEVEETVENPMDVDTEDAEEEQTRKRAREEAVLVDSQSEEDNPTSPVQDTSRKPKKVERVEKEVKHDGPSKRTRKREAKEPDKEPKKPEAATRDKKAKPEPQLKPAQKPTTGDKRLDKHLRSICKVANIDAQTPLWTCFGAGIKIANKWQLYLGVVSQQSSTMSCVHGDVVSLRNETNRYIVCHIGHDSRSQHYALFAWCTKPPPPKSKQLRVRKFKLTDIRWDQKDGSIVTHQQWRQMDKEWKDGLTALNNRVLAQRGNFDPAVKMEQEDQYAEEQEEMEDEEEDMFRTRHYSPNPRGRRTSKGRGKGRSQGKHAVDVDTESPKSKQIREQADKLSAMEGVMQEMRKEMAAKQPTENKEAAPAPAPSHGDAPPPGPPHYQSPHQPYAPSQAPTYQPAHPFQGIFDTTSSD